MQSAEIKPYNSWGNGSAMRVSPVGFAFDSTEDVLREAEITASVTHNHPEGIKGAQATALAIFLARRGAGKTDIRKQIGHRFGYNLDRSLDEIRPNYFFDVSCQGSVPESIIAFLESRDFEDAVRLAISLGGDSDTMGCIAGGIAQAHYGKIPLKIIDQVKQRLPQEFLLVIDQFNSTFGSGF
jgi:ADP-ribosylglycohydrolase